MDGIGNWASWTGNAGSITSTNNKCTPNKCTPQAAANYLNLNSRGVHIKLSSLGTFQVVGYSGNAKERSFTYEVNGQVVGSTSFTDTNCTESEIYTVNATGEVILTISSTGGSSYVYELIVTPGESTPIITSFMIDEVSAEVDNETYTITAELPFGTDISSVEPVVTLGGTAKTYTPTGNQDFTNSSTIPVEYTVYNEDLSVSQSYNVTITTASSLSNDATLKLIMLGDQELVGFNPDIYTYDVSLSYGAQIEDIPVVSVETNNIAATANITQATTIPGQAIIVVTAQDASTTLTYYINFFEYEPYHTISAETTFLCSRDNILDTSWVTYEYGSYSGRAPCTGSPVNIPNLSGVARYVEFSVTNCESFEIYADGNKNNNRCLTYSINGATPIQTEAWPNGCSSQEFHTGNTGDIVITIAGVDGSVYLATVVFKPYDGGATSMNEVNSSKAIASEEYYTLPGIRVVDPVDTGIYVKKVTYEDGSVEVTKVAK